MLRSRYHYHLCEFVKLSLVGCLLGEQEVPEIKEKMSD